MSPSGNSLMESVLALPEAERMAIAEALLSSLPDDELVCLEEELFAAELERRSQEMDEDPSASILWSEIKKHL